MEQEHRITYKAGITRAPSDFLCAEGELAECINMVTDKEELKPMVQPVKRFDSSITEYNTMIYVHSFNNEKRYIFVRKVPHTNNGVTTYSYRLIYGYESAQGQISYGDHPVMYYEAASAEEFRVSSIGKTLVVSAGNGLNYFLWQYDSLGDPTYKTLGEIPDPEVSFYLVGDHYEPDEYYWKDYVANQSHFGYTVMRRSDTHGILKYNNASDDPSGLYVDDGADTEKKETAFNDLVAGLYAKNKKSVAMKKGFCKPFFVRYALELYDGTFTHVSNPMLMVPAITRNTFVKQDVTHNDMVMFTKYCHLYYEMDAKNLEDFADIIKDVVIFISEGVDVHDTTIDQSLYEYVAADEGVKVIFDGIYRIGPGRSIKHQHKLTYRRNRSLTHYLTAAIDVLATRPSQDVLEDLRSTSVFYRLCGLGLKDDSGNIATKIDTHYLENLTAQDRLSTDETPDDYFSRNKLMADFLYVYNGRLNLANVSRGFFEGFDFFEAYDLESGTADYDFYVRIKTDAGDKWIHHSLTACQQKIDQMGYYFYPDPRADHIVIEKTVSGTTTRVLDAELTEHRGMNGSFYLNTIDGTDLEVGLFNKLASTPTVLPGSFDNDDKEMLPNYVLTSEVNNPWVFGAGGYNKVGTGQIMALATTVQALSDGKAGDFPLLIFSTSGIWALSVSDDGRYENMWNMSREILLNPKSVLETDEHVFFVSKKGLMVVEGRQVRCMSEQMNGPALNTNTLSPLAADTEWAGIVSACQDSTSFLEYVRSEDLVMAYDYIDSRILMTKPGKGYSLSYNIADGTISKVILPAAIANAVNDYPDYLLQGSVTVEQEGQPVTYNYIYTFYMKPREEEVSDRQLGFLLTRPMKLAGPVSQASLRQLMNVGTWNPGTAQVPLSYVKTDIYLSSDMQTWYNDISRHGAAARYYRVALFVKMLPTERLSGTILTAQERRGNNMR